MPDLHPDVQGRCPACNGQSLFLADGGYITCSRIDCLQPDAAHEAIEERAGANAYDRAINAPMSEQAAAHLRERLASRDAPRRKVRIRISAIGREPVTLAPAAAELLDTVTPELDAARRRAVTLVERIDAARTWARQHLTAEQAEQLYAVLRGDQPTSIEEGPK